jgi:hypothetical protein
MATTDHEPGRFILPNFQVSANIKQVCSNYRYQYLCLLQHLIRFLPSLNESFRCLPSFHANSNFRFGKRRSPHLESSRSKFWLTDFETPILLACKSSRQVILKVYNVSIHSQGFNRSKYMGRKIWLDGRNDTVLL